MAKEDSKNKYWLEVDPKDRPLIAGIAEEIDDGTGVELRERIGQRLITNRGINREMVQRLMLSKMSLSEFSDRLIRGMANGSRSEKTTCLNIFASATGIVSPRIQVSHETDDSSMSPSQVVAALREVDREISVTIREKKRSVQFNRKEEHNDGQANRD